jgi:hypothetical protein
MEAGVRQGDGILRGAAIFFAVGFAIHNADHIRRGASSVTPELFVAGNLAAVVSVAAIVLVLRRQAWARIALVVMSSLTIITGLGMILSVVALLWVVAAASVIILLFTGGANEWFARRPDGWSTPYGGGTGSSSYQQPGGTYGEQGPPSGW